MVSLGNVLAYYFCFARLPRKGRILDAGCGSGLFSFVASGAGRGKRADMELIGVDVFLPYLKQALGYDHRIQCSVYSLPFRDKQIDAVVSVEVLEHLTKEQGFTFLNEVERVCRGIVALSTPIGFKSRHESDDNPWMKHRSSWSPQELKNMGYSVRFLPDFAKKGWFFLPFAVIWRLRIPRVAATIIAFKHIK